MKKILDVLYQSDNNYADLTGVSITSLFENNKHLDEINIYILNDNISDDNIHRMEQLCNNYDRNLTIVNTEKILKKLKELNVEPYKGTYTTYFKLLAIESLKIKSDRLLQLDGDTIINEPLDELLSIDLKDFVCAATYDCILNDYKELVDIPKNDKYYNCGVLLINKIFWHDYRCEEKIINHLLNVRNRYFTVDQDIINVLFRDRIKYLDIKYNLNSGFYIYGIDESFRIYGLDESIFTPKNIVKKAMDKPYINHCMGAMTGRPWEKNNCHPQNDLYDEYLKISPWWDVPKKIVNRGILFKIQKYLYKILPIRLYGIIHKFILKKYLKKMNDVALNR